MSLNPYQTENNLFQSPEWADFQSALGRELVSIDALKATCLDIPFGKKFVWAQKGPVALPITNYQLPNLDKNLVFIRLEPGSVSSAQIKSLGLRLVTKKSLLSGQASPKATRLLDLTKSEEELLTQMKSKTRYNIRLAEKKGVKITESNDVEAFYEMLTATSGKKTGYFPHEKAYYETLIKVLGPKKLARIYLAEHNGQVLAAIMVTFYGKTATYLHGGQNSLAKNLMAPYLCQWAAIKAAKEAGCDTYDFWGVAESDDPNDPWAGITRFKEGFGGEKVVFPGSFDLVLVPFWYNLLTFAATVKNIMRKS